MTMTISVMKTLLNRPPPNDPNSLLKVKRINQKIK
jgi:hypothetical protein